MADTDAQGETRWAHARHGKLRRSNSWGNAARVALTSLLVIGLSSVSVAAYAVWGFYQDVETVELADDANTVGLGNQSIDGELNILLVGSDTRDGQVIDDGEEGELNDVTMLLHVAADHKSATVVSFPRDLMIPIPSCPGPDGEADYYPAMAEQQLNSAISYGGLPCVASTISELTGMPVPYASLITFDGVIGVSNAIGGVEVCLTAPIVDPKADLDLPEGMNTLKGYEALQFLRTRQGVGDGGDTSRISNQQVFMSALVRQLKSADTLGNPQKVYALAKAGVENMTMSSNMARVEFMQAVAGTVKDIDLERINFVQYPSVAHPYEEGRLTPNYEDAEILFDVLKSGEAFTPGATGEGVDDGTTPEDETVAPPVDDAAPAETPATEAPADGSAKPPVTDDGKVKLPESVTGLPADVEACQGGRTVY